MNLFKRKNKNKFTNQSQFKFATDLQLNSITAIELFNSKWFFLVKRSIWLMNFNGKKKQ